MSLIASTKTENNIPLIEEGTYPAVCYGVVDLGLQYSETYQSSSPKVAIFWEIPSEQITLNDGTTVSRTISSTYTNSLNRKAVLRKDLAAWRGRDFTQEELNGFNLANIVGVPCLLNIIHNESGGKTYANVGAVMKMAKGMEQPIGRQEQIVFDLDDSPLDMLDKLPKWVADRIRESETYRARVKGDGDLTSEFTELDEDDGDLPF